ncbi:MAG: MATE family efflux transporter [Lachnospiraceae bacterium]|nr:MATE family efflux transporter [Lachnospiraceae bacterium]
METKMTEGSPLKIILRFMAPLLLGNIFQQFYNMVDTIIVGKYVGAKSLAAVGSTGTIMFLVMGFSLGMTTGFTVLTSQKYGAGDRMAAKGTVANGIILSAIVVLILTVLSRIVMHPLLRLMNTPADIYQDAYSYISVICLGIVATVYYNLFSSFLRAVGNSRIPLYFLILSAFLNIILDLLFIIRFKMGVAGAAWATNVSQGVSAICCLIYIRSHVDVLTPEKGQWRLSRSYTKSQIYIGLPMALQFGITASGTMIMQTAINMFGSVAVAGFTAASKVQNLLTQGMMACGQTMAAYSGQNYGKMDMERVEKGTWDAMKIMTVYSLLAALLAVACLPYMLQLFFSSDISLSELMPWASVYVRECVIFYIPLSMIFIYRNTMQGCGYGMTAMSLGLLEFLARLVTALVSMKLASYPLAAGADPAAWFVAGIASIFLYRRVRRDIQSRLKTATPIEEANP